MEEARLDLVLSSSWSISFCILIFQKNDVVDCLMLKTLAARPCGTCPVWPCDSLAHAM